MAFNMRMDHHEAVQDMAL